MHLKKIFGWIFVVMGVFTILTSGCRSSQLTTDVAVSQPASPPVVRLTSMSGVQPVHPQTVARVRQVILSPPWDTFVTAVKLGGHPANSLQVLGSPASGMGDYQWNGPGWSLLVGVNLNTKKVITVYGSSPWTTHLNTVADIASALGVRKKPYRAYLSLSSVINNGSLGLYIGYTQPNGNVLVINGLFPQSMLEKKTDFNTARDTYSINPSFSLDQAPATEVYWGPQTKNIFGSGYNEITWVGIK